MFPNNAKTIYKDIHSTDSGLLLEAKNYDRTLLYGEINCDTTNNTSIVMGSILTQPNDKNFLSNEYTRTVSTLQARTLPANNDLNYVKTSEDKCNFTVVYIDYLLSTGTTTQASSTATTTQLYIFGFSYGESLTILLLLLILITLFFTYLKDLLLGVKVSNFPKDKENFIRKL